MNTYGRGSTSVEQYTMDGRPRPASQMTTHSYKSYSHSQSVPAYGGGGGPQPAPASQNYVAYGGSRGAPSPAPSKMSALQYADKPGFNPCCCLSLKTAVYIVGFWGIIYSILFLSLSGWQLHETIQRQYRLGSGRSFYARTFMNQNDRSRTYGTSYNNYGGGSSGLGSSSNYGGRQYGGNYNNYRRYSERQVYDTLLGIHATQIVTTVLLLCASCFLLYSVENMDPSKPSIIWILIAALDVIVALAYCIQVWAVPYIRYDFTPLTGFVFVTLLINIFCIVVVYAWQRDAKRWPGRQHQYQARAPPPPMQYDPYGTGAARY